MMNQTLTPTFTVTTLSYICISKLHRRTRRGT